MGGSRARRVGLVYGVGQVAALLVALWLNRQYHLGSTAALVVVLVPTLPGAFLGWAAYRDDRAEAALDLDVKARVLAAAVRASERDQVAQLLGAGGRRIDVAFGYVPESAGGAAGASGAAGDGRLADVLAYYRALRPGRLVITGEPGAGKTLLALQLLLDTLDDPDRDDGDPVPVRVSLAGWDTRQPLTQWLAGEIHQRYGYRGIGGADAYALVDQRRVLPVLDGLDEMDTATAPVGRRRAARALARLNDYQDTQGSAPLVLTCRSGQYDELAAADVRMRDAARVRIRPVTAVQADAYLTARTTTPARWAPVLTMLATAPRGTLAGALDTPWRLNLAATVYEQRDGDTQALLRDPADLLTLASPAAVRDHLLARHIEAATAQHPGPYTAAQVHRWLSRLATHLAGPPGAAAGTDLVLHRLWTLPGPRRIRAADVVFAAVLTFCTVAALLTALRVSLSVGHFWSGGWLIPLVFPVVAAGRGTAGPPRSARISRLTAPTDRRRLRRDLAGGLLIGVAAGPPVGLLVGLAAGSVVGLATGLTFGLAYGLVNALTGPVTDTTVGGRPAPAMDPRHPIRDDLVVWPAIGLPLGLALWLTAGPAFALTVEPLLVLSVSAAARRYLVFLCYCHGRLLPWRLGAFLNWAYDAGLLRISGIAYQFRHRELQDWLAAHPARAHLRSGS